MRMPMPHLLAASGAVGAFAVFLCFYVAVIVFEVAALWKVFTKASRPGWAAVIPLYNTYTMLKVVGRSGWWLLLLVIPFVNLVAAAVVVYDLARSFGKGGGFAIGLFFLSFIFIPILGFSSDPYVGPAAVMPGV